MVKAILKKWNNSKSRLTNLTKLVSLAITASLVGCSGIPYAVVDGSRAKVTDNDAHAVYISGVDGKMIFRKEFWKNIEPGKRKIRLTTTKSTGRADSLKESKTIEIDAQPCKRYLVQAKHDKNKRFSSKFWEVELIRVEDIASCKIPEGYVVPGQAAKSSGSKKLASN